MMSDNKKKHRGGVVLPTAPGSNPSSFPGISVPITSDDPRFGNDRGDRIDPPSGARIAPNGAVTEAPLNTVPEIDPPYKYTSDKEDLDLLIM